LHKLKFSSWIEKCFSGQRAHKHPHLLCTIAGPTQGFCVTEATAVPGAAPSDTSGDLSIAECTPSISLSGQMWTTRGSLAGLYDEPQSGHQLIFRQSDSRLYLTFLGSAWSTANCTLSSSSHSSHSSSVDIDGTSGSSVSSTPRIETPIRAEPIHKTSQPDRCVDGRFVGGPVGADYPDCVWNATISLPTIETTETSAGCKGCCLHTSWVKRGCVASAPTHPHPHPPTHPPTNTQIHARTHRHRHRHRHRHTHTDRQT
jgi:hypothetical protein